MNMNMHPTRKTLLAIICGAALGGASLAVVAQGDTQPGAGAPELAADDAWPRDGRHAGRQGHRRGRGPDVERLAVILDLTGEQKAALTTAFEEQRAQREAMREAMREEMRARMAGILDEAQLAKLEALREMRGNRHHKGRRGGAKS